MDRSSGTSYASPFVAGVAALVWAADPTLSDHEVEDILLDTAYAGASSSEAPRWVNAYGAVIEPLGEVPAPYVELLASRDGDTFQEGEDTTTVDVGAFESDAGPVVIVRQPNEGRRYALTDSTPTCHRHRDRWRTRVPFGSGAPTAPTPPRCR